VTIIVMETDVQWMMVMKLLLIRWIDWRKSKFRVRFDWLCLDWSMR
jgi:hypothetical protein